MDSKTNQKSFEKHGIFDNFKNWKIQQFKLGDLFEIKRGNPKFTKEFISKNPGNFPVYSAATKNNGELGRISTFEYDGNYITITTNGDAGYVFYRNGKFNMNSDCVLLNLKRQEFNLKFFYYILFSIVPKNRHENNGRPKMPTSTLKNIQIPVPPIEIQEKIAEILDNFTNLINTLKSENNIRNKQFSYYQKQFLSFLDFNTHTHRERERERERAKRSANTLQKYSKNNFWLTLVQI
ncbi:restriction endonuclease subunit S [Mesomycoplasma dispar]|uniref:Type I restriction modification DNA specificity domain-containing protein n=1 Tax=Mesomycoplasma dispar TaxID=86660 RepID=A0ABM6PRR5_9BACT|nr:restriction endonuclease subunit S [Mesomycoplasma dispar]ATP59837.1 hypothetical protein CSW10_02780 [Mesomycoplasma dispar]